MVEETVTPEPNFLEQVRTERTALEKLREENTKILKQMQDLRAEEIMSGKTNAGQKPKEEPKPIDPKEYAESALKGVIKDGRS